MNEQEKKTTSAEENAEISIAELRNEYAKKAKEQYDAAAKKLREERDEALRENWILQQQAEAALPEQMAAAGINGGAGETSLAALRAQYQGNRNDIRSGYMDELGDLALEQGEQQAETEKGYNEKWLEYLLSLAQMEKKYEYEKGK